VELPWPFLEERAEVTGPMFAALFGISIDLMGIVIFSIQFLRDLLPIFDFCFTLELVYFGLDYFGEKLRLKLGPIMSG
jgi:hypothetical protein